MKTRRTIRPGAARPNTVRWVSQKYCPGLTLFMKIIVAPANLTFNSLLPAGRARPSGSSVVWQTDHLPSEPGAGVQAPSPPPAERRKLSTDDILLGCRRKMAERCHSRSANRKCALSGARFCLFFGQTGEMASSEYSYRCRARSCPQLYPGIGNRLIPRHRKSRVRARRR